MTEVTQEQEQLARGSIRHKAPVTTDQRIEAIGKDVARLADAVEAVVALCRAEIARTSR